MIYPYFICGLSFRCSAERAGINAQFTGPFRSHRQWWVMGTARDSVIVQSVVFVFKLAREFSGLMEKIRWIMSTHKKAFKGYLRVLPVDA